MSLQIDDLLAANTVLYNFQELCIFFSIQKMIALVFYCAKHQWKTKQIYEFMQV